MLKQFFKEEENEILFALFSILVEDSKSKRLSYQQMSDKFNQKLPKLN